MGTWKGSQSKADAEKSLLAADRAFSEATAKSGIGAAYANALHPEAFFQRMGFEPMHTRQAAIDWFAQHVKTWSTEPMKVETAASADLGYTWGKYAVTPKDGAAYTGYYVRVWTRDARGTWSVVAEVTTPKQ
jgi:ketosteroid isomerase-like protein